jgi:site-specific DNA recombinase
MERRKAYALHHGIRKLKYATADNPFAGKVICGTCGHIFGRKVWNSTDERLRIIIWWCNGKYPSKGKRGCESRHIDDKVLYQAFINTFNAMIENKDYFLDKWQDRLESDNVLVRYKAKQFMGILAKADVLDTFDIDLYFALVEKVMIYDSSRLIVSLLDSTEIECETE